MKFNEYCLNQNMLLPQKRGLHLIGEVPNDD